MNSTTVSLWPNKFEAIGAEFVEVSGNKSHSLNISIYGVKSWEFVAFVFDGLFSFLFCSCSKLYFHFFKYLSLAFSSAFMTCLVWALVIYSKYNAVFLRSCIFESDKCLRFTSAWAQTGDHMLGRKRLRTKLWIESIQQCYN